MSELLKLSNMLKPLPLPPSVKPPRGTAKREAVAELIAAAWQMVEQGHARAPGAQRYAARARLKAALAALEAGGE